MALDSKTPMTAAEFAALMGQQDFTKMQHPLEWWLERATITIDQAGTPHFAVNTSGQAYSVEASATAILNNNISLLGGLTSTFEATVAAQGAHTAGSGAQYAHRKKVVTLAAADGGGLVAATPLVSGPAGFYPVIDGLMLWSTVADTFTANFTPTGGAVVGPAVLSYTTVANVVNLATEKGLWYNLTDASVINIDISGATVGMVINCIVLYHYET